MGVFDNTQSGVLSQKDKDLVYTAVQVQEINKIIADAGYSFDPQQNIFYSTLNTWQRELGYCSLYDEASTPIGLVFDCEPVRFEYGGKRWMIELWKGQYGITTGGEIGIYTTAGPDLAIPGVFDGTFYNCADDEDHLSMAYTLLKNNKVLFYRAARHWWLTGFKLGEYTEPSELTMEVSITFKDQLMRDAFLSALYDIGYTEDEIRYGGNTVLFLFAKPHSEQPLTRKSFISYFMLQRLQSYVDSYKEITNGANNIYDDILALKAQSPLLFDFILNMGRQKALFNMHDTILQYL